jgi:transposase-like protein
MPATLKQRQAAAAILRDGGSYADAARVSKVNRSTVIRWAQEDENGNTALPDATGISTPRAVLEALLGDESPRIRLDAARALAALDLDNPDDAIPDYDRLEIINDLAEGGKPYSVLQVHRPPDTAPDTD